VDESCAERERQNVTDECVVSADERLEQPSVDEEQEYTSVTDVFIQEPQHADVHTELSCQCTEDELPGIRVAEHFYD